MSGYKIEKKVAWKRVISDLQYIVLNKFVNQIPCWKFRRSIYKKMGMTIGKEARIGIGTVILNPAGIKLGDRSVVNENCLLDGRGGLTIGHDTSISAYTKIITASHRGDRKKFDYYRQKTKIGNCVWIGMGAIILDGSAVKNYVIIGAGSVLKGKTEEKDIMIGNPAQCIRKRELEQGYQLNYKAYFR